MNIRTHIGFLSIMSTIWGASMTIAMGVFVYKMLERPIPIKLLFYVMLICFSGGVAVAELMWLMYFKKASRNK